MGIKHMQGVPAHLETLHNSDGKRRDKRRCIFYFKSEKMCDCPQGSYSQKQCPGSSHCEYYKERKENEL